jgi:hypothetical protein
MFFRNFCRNKKIYQKLNLGTKIWEKFLKNIYQQIWKIWQKCRKKGRQSTEELTGTGRGSWPHRRSRERLLAPELTRRGAPARLLVGELTWVAAHAADHLADAREIPQDAAPEAVRCAGELARACNPAYGLLTGGGRYWNGVHHCCDRTAQNNFVLSPKPVHVAIKQ